MKADKTIKYYINNSEVTEEAWKKYSISDMTVTDMGGFWAISNDPKTTIFKAILESLEDKEGMSTRHKAATRMASDISYEDQAKKIIEDLEKGNNFSSARTIIMSPEEKIKRFAFLNLDTMKAHPDLINQNQELRQTFSDEKEGVKHSEGKTPMELDFTFVRQLAERMHSNKKNGKYAPNNWKKTIDIQEIKDAAMRHLIEVMEGNYEDDGREYGHLEAVCTNIMVLNYQLKNLHNKK